MAANMLLSRWSNQGVNLWKVELVTQNLVQGQATYPVDPSIVMILDSYVTTNSGSSSTNRIILPISRTEYASYPNPQQQGFTTVYWFDRLISPTITLWPTWTKLSILVPRPMTVAPKAARSIVVFDPISTSSWSGQTERRWPRAA